MFFKSQLYTNNYYIYTKKIMIEVVLFDLPKISLNEWYAGKHWSKRSKLKDTYKLIIKNQFKQVFEKGFEYTVFYNFLFKNNPLDASNCVAMIKLIEDIIFQSDGYNTVKTLHIQSNKSNNTMDYVKIHVYKKEIE